MRKIEIALDTTKLLGWQSVQGGMSKTVGVKAGGVKSGNTKVGSIKKGPIKLQ